MPTHRENVLRKFGLSKDTHLSLRELAAHSGIRLAALNEVYRRGLGAAKTNPESIRLKGSFKKDPSAPRSMKLSAPQWAMARAYAFVDRGPSFYGADADIAKKYSIV